MPARNASPWIVGMSAVFAAVFSGCSADYSLDEPAADATGNDAEPAAPVGDADGMEASREVTLVVQPTGAVGSDGRALLAQAFLEVPGDGVDLRLRETASVEGRITAWSLTPTSALAATLPGVRGPLEGALVSLSGPGVSRAAQGLTAREGDVPEGATGTFQLPAAAGPDQRLTVVPADPLVPFVTVLLDASEDARADLDLGYGAPVYGQVLGPGGAPLAGVAVRAVRDDGVEGAPAYTDDEGFYTLRVSPGAYRLAAEGRGTRRAPRLEQAVEVGEAGLAADFAYPSLDLASAGGRATDGAGRGLAGVTATFVSRSLDGYGEGASFSAEAISNSDGLFDTRLPPGGYEVRITPASLDFGEVRIADLRVSGTVDLGAVALAETEAAAGVVLGPQGQALGGAQISVEDGSGRFWQALTDDLGQFVLEAPPMAGAVWTVAPPADRAGELAIGRFIADTGADMAFQLIPGERFAGQVTAQGANGRPYPLAFAVVEAQAEDGTVLGVALTDNEGGYTLRVRR